MTTTRRSEDREAGVEAISRWECDGGRLLLPPRDPGGRGSALCLPSLPSGYHSQPAFGFRDPTGRFFYAFHFVYRPAASPGRSVAIMVSELDEGMSFWAATGPTDRHGAGDEPVGRWMSYAERCGLGGSRPAFDAFSSLWRMRGALPELLQARNIAGGEAAPRVLASVGPVRRHVDHRALTLGARLEAAVAALDG